MSVHITDRIFLSAICFMNHNLIQLSYDAFQTSQTCNKLHSYATFVASLSHFPLQLKLRKIGRLGNASSQLQSDKSGQLLHKVFPAIHCVNWGKHH